MTARTRVPRASLAVSILRDPDYVVLMGAGTDGKVAFAAFVSIILIAKDLGNQGRFVEPLSSVASMIRWDTSALESAIGCIRWACKQNGHRPWLTVTKDGLRLRVRNFKEWNASSGQWGGRREGAGRKHLDSPAESSCIQDETPPQVGIGIGEGEGDLKRGNARGEAPLGSGACYMARDFSAELWAGLPDHAKTGPNTITAAIATAMQDYGVEGQHIVDRTLAFYRSPMGRAEYYRSTKPANFITRGGYNEPDSAWKDPNAKPATGSTTPVYNESAAVKRRAQDDAVRQQHADDPGALARAAAEYQEQHTATTAEEQT